MPVRPAFDVLSVVVPYTNAARRLVFLVVDPGIAHVHAAFRGPSPQRLQRNPLHPKDIERIMAGAQRLYDHCCNAVDMQTKLGKQLNIDAIVSYLQDVVLTDLEMMAVSMVALKRFLTAGKPGVCTPAAVSAALGRARTYADVRKEIFDTVLPVLHAERAARRAGNVLAMTEAASDALVTIKRLQAAAAAEVDKVDRGRLGHAGLLGSLSAMHALSTLRVTPHNSVTTRA